MTVILHAEQRPIRIVVDLRIADRPGMERTGVGRYAVEATRELCRARPEWQFTLLTNRDLVVEPNARSRRTLWPTKRSWGRVGWLHLGSRWQVRPPEFACWIGTAFTLPLWWRGRSIVTIHDLMFLEQRAVYSGRVNALYATAATKRAARKADVIVCGSRETQERLTGRWSINPRKVAVTPYGVSEVFFARQAPPAGARPAFVLYVGTFESRKGIDTLHAAMRALNADRAEPVELVLAGHVGWGADETLARLRADPAVTFRIDPSDPELAALYAAATVMAYPSRAEGFGLPVAEALACGCAVVSSDLACVREFAGDAPRYVPVDDVGALRTALEGLLHDADDRRRREETGRVLAAPRRWEAVGEELAVRVESVIA